MFPNAVKARLKDYEPYESFPLHDMAYKITTKSDKPPFKEVVLRYMDLGVKGTQKYLNSRKGAKIEVSEMEGLFGSEYIVKILDHFEYVNPQNKAFYYILTEYGGNDFLSYYLYDRRNGVKISFAEKMHVIIQIAKGWNFLQKNDLMHGDMKPENVVINKKKQIKLISFTTKRFAAEPDPERDDYFYGSGTNKFYVFYAPPEVLAQGEVKKDKVDIYCFGKMIYQILCEKTHEDMELLLHLYAGLISKYPPKYNINKDNYNFHFFELITYEIANVYPDLTELITKIIIKCLDFNPEKRYTFDELIEDLLKLSKIKPIPIPVVESTLNLPSEMHYLNPFHKKIYNISNEIAKYPSYDKSYSGSIKKSAVTVTGLPDLDYEKTSWITAPNNVVYIVGGSKTISKHETGPVVKEIYEVSIKDKNTKKLPVELKKARNLAGLAVDESYVFILGGQIDSLDITSECEALDYKNNKMILLPALTEAKSEVATCIFSNYIYVFGGENSDYLGDKPKCLTNSFSTVVERLDKAARIQWEREEINKENMGDWNGCSLSAAIPTNDSIIIFGGFTRSKDDVEREVAKLTYTPASRKFSAKVINEKMKVKYFFNSGIRLKGDVYLACSNMKSDDQSFYTTGDKYTVQTINSQ